MQQLQGKVSVQVKTGLLISRWFLTKLTDYFLFPLKVLAGTLNGFPAGILSLFFITFLDD
jgi:hypothetical protein